MAIDPRDEIWKGVFNTQFDCLYYEFACNSMLSRWQWCDECTKVLVAITVSGSAVSGWALWSDPHFKNWWGLLAGAAAILAIVHSSLGVSGRLKDWGESKRAFTVLRIGLETMQYRMRINPAFTIDDFAREFVSFRERYSGAVERIKGDVFWTHKFEIDSKQKADKAVQEKYGE